ncbi:MAG: TIGR00730 family Rossman fold protein [Planctomycetaceae bacterium]|nr:MAG: TIGR00730 family Rossman fold protein [Planctomycetaceae bacterium]
MKEPPDPLPGPLPGPLSGQRPAARRLHSLCVFCGSSTGNDPAFCQAAQALGDALVHQQITLVYGGGNIGLMGVIADRVMQGGGRAIGVIPRQLQEKELAHHGITDLHVVDSMHQRKARMAELAEAFVAMPGGYGTIEEFAEVLTWSQLGLHTKPMGLLNVSGYFDHFLRFLDHAVDVRLLQPEHRRLVLESDHVDHLLQQMHDWQAPSLPKWIESEAT